MKNERIRDAWNQATPSDLQREKMRGALALRMEVEEPVPQREENQKLDVQRLPVRRKKNAWIPIAAVLALVLAGAMAVSWMMRGREEADPSMVAPVEEEETVPADNREAAFQPIIDKYITAITERWDGGRCAQEDISILTRDVKSLDDLGYSLRDMNGDGQNELLITDGNVIYDMYVLIRGEVHHMFTGMERNAYYLAGKNAIINIASSSAAQTEYQVFSYTDGTLFDNQWVLRFDGERDPENPWLFQESPVNEAMANHILSQRPQIYIRHTPFSGNVVESDAPEDEALLLKYAASIPKALENYSKSQPVTFCFYDYNGDGKRELILGAGKVYYAVLNTYESTGEIRIAKPFAGERSDRYFCENGVLKVLTYGGDYSSYSNFRTIEFSRKDGPYFKIFLILTYEEATDTWTRSDWGEEDIDDYEVTQEEVQSILNSYPHLNLDWQPIEDFPVTIPASPRDLFEDAFVPIAIEATDRELDTLLLLGDIREWGKMGSKVEIVNPADKSSSLTAVVSGEEREAPIEEMRFTMTVNDIPRTVSVEFTPQGPVYRAFGDPSSKGVKMESVDELRSFLIREERTMEPWILAEEFAYAWFTQDKEAMDKAAKNGAVREFMDGQAMGPETEIEKMTMKLPGGNYISAAKVSIAFYEPGVTDSYTYLNLDMYMDNNGEWFVDQFTLEK